MDETGKNRIRLKHWVDHNKEHVESYSQMATLLEQSGHKAAAERLREGIRLSERANSEFQAALDALPDNPHAEEHHHHHHHGGHSHDHS